MTPNSLLKSLLPFLNSRSSTLTHTYTFLSAFHLWKKKPKTLSFHLSSPLPNRKLTLPFALFITSLATFSNPVLCSQHLVVQIALKTLSMALAPQINGNLPLLHKLTKPSPPLNILSLKTSLHSLPCTLTLLKNGTPKICPSSNPSTFGTKLFTFRLLLSLYLPYDIPPYTTLYRP